MNKIYNKIKNKIKHNDFFYISLKIISIYFYYLLHNITKHKYIKAKFYKKLGYPLNLKKPRSFHEKIFWKKIYDRNPLLPLTADKYLVRTYVKEILNEKKAQDILIPLLYVTDKPDTIPFEKICPPFIIKPNHASGLYLIVKNNSINKKEIIRTCQRWLKIPYGLDKHEWAYKPIKRKIVIERLLQEDDGKIPKDYKFYMFHGKCKLIRVFFDRMKNPSVSFFDEEWDFVLLNTDSYPPGSKIEKPENFEQMNKIAQELSQFFDFIRVDLYNINGKIYFSELTHYPGGGLSRYQPDHMDYELGKYWNIKKEYWMHNPNKL